MTTPKIFQGWVCKGVVMSDVKDVSATNLRAGLSAR